MTSQLQKNISIWKSILGIQIVTIYRALFDILRKHSQKWLKYEVKIKVGSKKKKKNVITAKLTAVKKSFDSQPKL